MSVSLRFAPAQTGEQLVRFQEMVIGCPGRLGELFVRHTIETSETPGEGGFGNDDNGIAMWIC
jgi:hypothetical protein